MSSLRSTTATRNPARARYAAQVRPLCPPPMTMPSNVGMHELLSWGLGNPGGDAIAFVEHHHARLPALLNGQRHRSVGHDDDAVADVHQQGRCAVQLDRARAWLAADDIRL